jgi:hypothetical protein
MGAHQPTKGGKNMSQIIEMFERMVENEELDEPFEEDSEEQEPLNLAQRNRDDQPPPKRRQRLTIDDHEKKMPRPLRNPTKRATLEERIKSLTLERSPQP